MKCYSQPIHKQWQNGSQRRSIAESWTSISAPNYQSSVWIVQVKINATSYKRHMKTQHDLGQGKKWQCQLCPKILESKARFKFQEFLKISEHALQRAWLGPFFLFCFSKVPKLTPHLTLSTGCWTSPVGEKENKGKDQTKQKKLRRQQCRSRLLFCVSSCVL